MVWTYYRFIGYWTKADWRQPEEIKMFLVVSTYYTEPGYNTFYVAKTKTDDIKAGMTNE